MHVNTCACVCICKYEISHICVHMKVCLGPLVSMCLCAVYMGEFHDYKCRYVLMCSSKGFTCVYVYLYKMQVSKCLSMNIYTCVYMCMCGYDCVQV